MTVQWPQGGIQRFLTHKAHRDVLSVSLSSSIHFILPSSFQPYRLTQRVLNSVMFGTFHVCAVILCKVKLCELCIRDTSLGKQCSRPCYKTKMKTKIWQPSTASVGFCVCSDKEELREWAGLQVWAGGTRDDWYYWDRQFCNLDKRAGSLPRDDLKFWACINGKIVVSWTEA